MRLNKDISFREQIKLVSEVRLHVVEILPLLVNQI